ncbi:hypothetical protein BGX24_002692 [Mortierella sp. AD032]|nr:hypothetical protein BGX24_002692 [Mortierella sp. AD032]
MKILVKVKVKVKTKVISPPVAVQLILSLEFGTPSKPPANSPPRMQDLLVYRNETDGALEHQARCAKESAIIAPQNLDRHASSIGIIMTCSSPNSDRAILATGGNLQQGHSGIQGIASNTSRTPTNNSNTIPTADLPSSETPDSDRLVTAT